MLSSRLVTKGEKALEKTRVGGRLHAGTGHSAMGPESVLTNPQGAGRGLSTEAHAPGGSGMGQWRERWDQSWQGPNPVLPPGSIRGDFMGHNDRAQREPTVTQHGDA